MAINTTNLRTKKHDVKFNVSVFKPDTILAAQVNNASIARGARSIAYDGGTGTYALIRSYQEVWVGTTPGSYDVGRVRVKSITGTITSGTITVDENGIVWADDHYLTIKHNYPPVAIAPRISGGVFKKFYDQDYTDENSQPPPVCIAGPHQVNRLTSGSYIFNIDLSNSYAVASGATISSYALSVSPAAGVSVVFDTGTGIGTVTATQEGKWWATCSCTDSNGKTQERFLALIIDSSPYVNAQLTGWQEAWGQGVRASLTVFGDVLLADFPDEALVLVWYDQEFDDTASYSNLFTEGDNLVFAGYIRSDTSKDDFAGDGTHEINLELSTGDTLLDNIPLDSVGLEAVTNPAKWQEYNRTLTLGRGVHHYLKWHSSILETMDVIGLLDNTLLARSITFQKGSMRQAINRESQGRGVFAQLTADRLGRLHLAEDSQMLNTAGRAALSTILDIQESDISGPVTFKRNPEPRVYTTQVSGFSFDGINGTALVSLIPGYRESNVSYGIPERRGSGNQNIANQILASQTDSNEKVGRAHALANIPITEFRFTFRGSGYIGALTTIPTEGWYTLGIANTTLARQLSVNSIKLICRSITMSEDNNGDSVVSAVMQPEALGPDGIQGNYLLNIPTAPSSSAPRWQADEGLLSLVTWSSFYYKDDNNTNWTEVTTDTYGHGTIDPWWFIKEQSINPEDIIWWGAGAAGLITRCRGINNTPVVLTPVTAPPNTWSDSPAPTVAGLTILQIMGDPWRENRWYALAQFQNGSSQYRGWFLYSTDDGDSWTYVALYDDITLPTQVRPLWMAVNGTHLLITIWDDDTADTLRLLQFATSDLTYTSEFALGNATSAEVDAKTYIAYPTTVIDDDSLWYVFGRMNAPQSLANPEHVIKTANAGVAWSSFENGWTTDYAASLKVEKDESGTRKHYAIRQAN